MPYKDPVAAKLASRERVRRYRKRQRIAKKLGPAALELTGDPADVLAAWSASTLVVPAGHPNAGEPMPLPDYGVDFLRAAVPGSSRPRASARHWPARLPTSRPHTAPTSRDRPLRRRSPARRWATRLAAWAAKPGWVIGPEHGAAARLRRPTRHAVAAGTTAPAGQAGPLPAVAGRWGGVPFSAGALPARSRPPVTSAETSKRESRGRVPRICPLMSHATVAWCRPRRAHRFVDRRQA